MVKIPGFHCHEAGSISGWRTEIPQESKVTISIYGSIYPIKRNILISQIQNQTTNFIET